jgi:magnesium transporter
VGIYGMNFLHMPELAQPLGYPVALLGMAGVAGAIYVWFRRKGWL